MSYLYPAILQIGFSSIDKDDRETSCCKVSNKVGKFEIKLDWIYKVERYINGAKGEIS